MDTCDLEQTWGPRLLGVMRIMLGLLLVEHGASKILGWPIHTGFPAPPVLSLIWFAGVIELVGGPLIALGLLTRSTAFILSGFMAFAYFLQGAPKSFFPMNNGGEAAILFCFAFLYIVAAGPGAWSLDGLLGGRRRQSSLLPA